MSVAVSFRIPMALAKRLHAIAIETDRSRSFVIQKALEVYVEDYADLQIALDPLRDVTDPVVSGAGLRKDLGYQDPLLEVRGARSQEARESPGWTHSG